MCWAMASLVLPAARQAPASRSRAVQGAGIIRPVQALAAGQRPLVAGDRLGAVLPAARHAAAYSSRAARVAASPGPWTRSLWRAAWSSTETASPGWPAATSARPRLTSAAMVPG